ncbi:hypothetical protein R3W88_006108 [Solanum pinnatisectum]|uniref:Uncharacterized protein n=1 Tax=Solanum pinnatisectum TaxID=50273 RepID=A0AAV9KDV3_9SOLN|nr:hypothetical protein R3W88_006108 [Solanum pinnatisectum]
MDFLKCSIVGLQYGTRASDLELAVAKKLAETWPSEPNTYVILLFYWILAICYAAVGKTRRLEALIIDQILQMKYHFLLQQENSIEFFKRTQ